MIYCNTVCLHCFASGCVRKKYIYHHHHHRLQTEIFRWQFYHKSLIDLQGFMVLQYVVPISLNKIRFAIILLSTSSTASLLLKIPKDAILVHCLLTFQSAQ